MKTITNIVLMSILFATSIYSLIRCPDFTKVRESIPFQPMSVICDLIEQEKYAESYVYYINANFSTETCTYSPLTRAFISPQVIIAVDNKTIYRRGPKSHTIRPPCLPARAEYLTGDVYLLIQSIPHPTGDMFKLEDSFKNATCAKFLDEVADISSGNSTYEEKLKFIRRVTAYDGLIGDIQDGKIHYVRCDTFDQPIVDKEIFECDCFYGALVYTSDDKRWYSKNGLDIDDATEVDKCISYTNSPIYLRRSIGFDNGSGGFDANGTFVSIILKYSSSILSFIQSGIIFFAFIILMTFCFCFLKDCLYPNKNMERSQGTRNIGSHVSHA
uniref:Glycoprotein n=1 Tax=Strongyloides papillosus TaxID=174720 RepID=A0A0N5BI45_STREA